MRECTEMSKVVFFSESQVNENIPRNFENARTEYGLDDGLMLHYNINNIPTEQFDLGIVIVPKSNPNVNLDSFRSCCKKVASNGEALIGISKTIR